jgi:poly(3-hydroxybutyrate) depolymerase
VPLVAVQGLADSVVAPRNATALARQYLALNGVEPAVDADMALPPADSDTSIAAGARSVRTREWQRGGRVVVRLVEIEGLGHAWSGGDEALPYNDAAPPDATALAGTFLGELVR